MVMSLDIGYGDNKVYVNGKVFKFPSSIQKIGVMMNGFSDDTNIITFNGEKYLVGETAKNPIITRNFEFLEEYTPLFIYYAAKRAGVKLSEITELRLGLSLVNILNPINKKKYFDIFTRQYVINGELVKFPTLKLNVQGVGVFNIFKKTHKEAFKDVFVIDIGYNTLDAISFIDGKPNALASFANEKGINLIIKDIKIIIQNQFGKEISEQMANDILKDKVFKFAGVSYNLTKEIKKLIDNYIDNLVYELKTRANDSFSFSDFIVFGGGGVYLLKDHIDLQPNFVFIDKPEFGNVLGY